MNMHHKRIQVTRIHAGLRELKDLAEAERCDFLTHLLAMAYIESGDILRGLRTARAGEGPLPAVRNINRRSTPVHGNG